MKEMSKQESLTSWLESFKAIVPRVYNLFFVYFPSRGCLRSRNWDTSPETKQRKYPIWCSWTISNCMEQTITNSKVWSTLWRGSVTTSKWTSASKNATRSPSSEAKSKQQQTLSWKMEKKSSHWTTKNSINTWDSVNEIPLQATPRWSWRPNTTSD